MSIMFPGPVNDDGQPTEIQYHGATEAARRLHVSRQTFREMCRRKLWPHLNNGGRYYVNDDQLARIVELMTTDVDAIPDDLGGPIGSVIDEMDDDGEGVR